MLLVPPGTHPLVLLSNCQLPHIQGDRSEEHCAWGTGECAVGGGKGGEGRRGEEDE